MGTSDTLSKKLGDLSVSRGGGSASANNKENDFKLINQLNEIRVAEETSASFNNLTIGVAVISLIIGGIGILAVMLLSVKERINEMGVLDEGFVRERMHWYCFRSGLRLAAEEMGQTDVLNKYAKNWGWLKRNF